MGLFAVVGVVVLVVRRIAGFGGRRTVGSVRGAGQALKDDAATHGDDLGGAPCSGGWTVRNREVGGRVHDVEGCEHGDDISVVDTVNVDF